MSKIITDESELNTSLDDLITEDYALEILGLKNVADFRKFSRSFMKLSKIVKGIENSDSEKLDKDLVSEEYNTAKKIEDKIKKINNEKLDKGLVSEEYDTAKKIEDKIKEAKKAGTDAGTEANKKLDKGNVQTKYDTAEKIGNEIDKKFDKGSLPAKISDAKDLYDLIQNNSGLNFDENLLFLNDAGTKYVNKIYFDRNKKGLFKCISQTTSTTNSTSYFVDISNEANSAQLRNLYKYSIQYENSGGTTSLITTRENMNNYRFICFVFNYYGGPTLISMVPVSEFKRYHFGYDMRGGENADRNYSAQILYKGDAAVQATGRLRIFKVIFIS